MSDLEQEIKELIVRSLELEGMSPADIDTKAPLFGEGLGLDSVDALELGMSLYKQYGLKLDIGADDVRQHFQSVASLAKLVRSHQSLK